MDKIIAFSNRTDGRDKFTKAIQYSAKLIAWYLREIDKNYYKKFNDLFCILFVFYFSNGKGFKKDIQTVQIIPGDKEY